MARSSTLGPAARPVAIPDDVDGSKLQKEAGKVELPLHVRWSDPVIVYDLSNRHDRARVYEQVLREGDDADVRRFIVVDHLIDLWDELVLPRHVRSAWAEMAWPAPAGRSLVLTSLQERIIEIVRALPSAEGFALAGGGALIARALIERGTRDLDFFTTQPDQAGVLIPALELALQAQGLAVERRQIAPGFGRLVVSSDDEHTAIDLASDFRLYPRLRLSPLCTPGHPDALGLNYTYFNGQSSGRTITSSSSRLPAVHATEPPPQRGLRSGLGSRRA